MRAQLTKTESHSDLGRKLLSRIGQKAREPQLPLCKINLLAARCPIVMAVAVCATIPLA
jgi:hypothetical protein